MFQPTPVRAGININHLETQSRLSTQLPPHRASNPLPAPSQSRTQQETPHSQQIPPPLASLSVPAPRKVQKKRRLEPEDTENPRYPQPLEELLKQTAAQLRKVAQENSKGTFTAADEEFFLEFYKEQEQTLAIKAIERAVSLPMVHAFLGRRIAVREANRWNRFLQTDRAREIFQMSGQGVKNREVMKQLSAAYNQLSPEEKAALAIVPDSEDEEELDSSIPSNNQHHPRGPNPLSQAERDLTAAELPLDDNHDDHNPADNSRPPSYPSGVARSSQPSIVRRSVPNIHLKEQTQKVMNRWTQEAASIAKTCNCEIVFFAVSKHLSTHSFQLVRSTPGANESVKTLADMDGNSHYAARLQALMTGNSVTEITVKEKFPTSKKLPLRALIPQLSKELGQLIARKTKNVIMTWPWTDTDKILRSAKVRVELSPRANSDINWIKEPYRHLKKIPCSMILLDLSLGHIRVVPIPPSELTDNNGHTETDRPEGVDGGTGLENENRAEG